MVPHKELIGQSTRRMNFTKRSLDALEAPATSKQIYYFDTQVRGLCISVAKGGNKAFVLRRKIDGRSERIWLGHYPDMSIEQARKAAYEKNAEISGGVNPGEIRREKKKDLSLESIFCEYIERHAEKKRKTAAVMRKDFDRYLGHWKNRVATSISNRDVEELHRRLAERRGPYVANRTIQLLRAVINKAIAWDIFKKDNPARGITLFPEKSRERFLSKEEATRLLIALEGDCNHDLRDFIKLSFFTGVRKGNLMSIEWKWINWNSRTLSIPDTKNGTKQVVPLGSLDIVLLEARKARLRAESLRKQTPFSEYVFPGTGSKGHLLDLKRSWTSFRKQVNLEDITIHDLRRSLAATMANANTNLSLVKSALHHKDMKTTLSVYARSQDEAIRDAKHSALSPILEGAGLIKRSRPRKKRRKS